MNCFQNERDSYLNRFVGHFGVGLSTFPKRNLFTNVN